MMNIKCFEFNMFPVNTYVLWDSVSRESIIIDPGCLFPGESDQLKDYIMQNGLTVKHLLNTHLHFDHIFGNPFVEQTFNIKAQANNADIEWLLNVRQRVRVFGIEYNQDIPPIERNNVLNEGDTITIKNISLYVYHIPGHSPGSLVFYERHEKVLFSGDVLFQGSIGRTDFPDSDPYALTSGIRQKLFALPDDTKVYPGHGPATTIKYEKKYNYAL